MTAVTTWSELGTIDGPALLIVTAAAGDEVPVDEAFRALSAKVSADALHVIAPSAWQRWFEERGQPTDRLLICVDGGGREVELMHFLHSSAALSWIGPRGFQVVMGTLPHKRHNEEVQELFEQRVCLFLGHGRFLAHTLPDPYIYTLDAPALVHRFGRSADVARYLAVTHDLVAELHGQWLAAGSPAVNDTGSHDGVLAALDRHLGSDVRGVHGAPLPLPSVTHRSESEVASYLAELHATLCERDRRLAGLEAYLEERNEAVALRDGIISDLRAEMDQRLVRLALGIMRRLRPPR